MSLNGKQDNFSYNDLIDVANKAGINRANEIIEKIVDVASHWKEYAKDCGVKDSHAKEIEQNLLLLEKSKFCTPEQNREFEIEL